MSVAELRAKAETLEAETLKVKALLQEAEAGSTTAAAKSMGELKEEKMRSTLLVLKLRELRERAREAGADEVEPRMCLPDICLATRLLIYLPAYP
jgi:hypothetical protein